MATENDMTADWEPARKQAWLAGETHYLSSVECLNNASHRVRYVAGPGAGPCLECQMLRRPTANTSRKLSDALHCLGIQDPRSEQSANPSSVALAASLAPVSLVSNEDATSAVEPVENVKPAELSTALLSGSGPLPPLGFMFDGPVTLDGNGKPTFPAKSKAHCGYYVFTVDERPVHVGYTGNWGRRYPHYRNGPAPANRRIRENIRHAIREGQSVGLWLKPDDRPSGIGESALRKALDATAWHGSSAPLLDGCLESHKAHLAQALHTGTDQGVYEMALAFCRAFEQGKIKS